MPGRACVVYDIGCAQGILGQLLDPSHFMLFGVDADPAVVMQAYNAARTLKKTYDELPLDKITRVILALAVIGIIAGLRSQHKTTVMMLLAIIGFSCCDWTDWNRLLPAASHALPDDAERIRVCPD